MQEAGFARYPQLEPNSKSMMKTKLTLFVTVLAAGLFVVAMLSCSYGLLFTTIPSKSRNWIKFRRTLTNVVYVAIIPHVLIRSFGVWIAAVLIIALFLVWRFNPQISGRLKTINWRLHKAHRRKG